MSNFILKDVLPLLKNLKPAGGGYTCRCPSHDDRKNSLSLTQAENGKLLLNCHAGCTYQDILAALNISTGGVQNKIETVYDYTNESGKVLYQNVRYENKDFRWRQRGRNGREIWNLKGVRRVPYRLPQLMTLPQNNAFILAEGEKDADALTKHRLTATNHKNWLAEFNYLLKGRNAVIFQDHDKAGVEFAEKAAQLILREVNALKIVDCFADEPLPDKHGKDVSDYLAANGYEKLLELIRGTADWTTPKSEETSGKDEAGLKVVCLSDVVAENIEWLWKPFIPIGEFTIIEGIEGLGKSWIGCALACAVAAGNKLPFDDHEPLEPGNVLMLSAEDSLSHTVKPRLVSMQANLERIFAIDEVFSFSEFKDLIKFEAVIAEHKPKLVIIDPLFSYTGGKNLNQESESRPIARKIIEIAQKFDCAIIGVRHIGKAKGNGDARAAGLGSVAWRASARSVLIVGKDEETGEKAICQTKNNLAEESKIAVGFEIQDGQFYWLSAPSRLTKEKMLAQPKDDETKAEQNEAVAFLREALQGGERSSRDLDREAKEAGISNYAIRKAKAAIGVKSTKKGGNYGGAEKGWFVRLPDAEEGGVKNEDADSADLRHLQATPSDNTSYSNRLAEDVEQQTNQRLHPEEPTTSDRFMPIIRMPTVCKCGTNGFVGEDCQNCRQTIIPF